MLLWNVMNHSDMKKQRGLWTVTPLFSSVQFSHSVMSDSLRPQRLEHTRLLYPSPTPRVYSYSWPLSRWCHPTVSSSVVPFSSCLQSFPASGSLQTSQFFTSGGQSIGVSASVSVLPMNNPDWLYNSQQYILAEKGKLWSKRQSHSLLFSCSVMFDSVTPWNV